MRRRVSAFLGRFRGERRGGVTIIVAASMIVLLGFCGFAVDLGGVFLKARKLQGIADLAAMAAAMDLAHADAAAQATAKDNLPDLTVATALGAYAPDPLISPKDRFKPAAVNPNAARVEVSGKAELYFASMFVGRPSLDIHRTATASQVQLAAFSIGSRLASLNGGVANKLLSALTGSTVSLSVMDYNALLSSDVDILSYSKALRLQAGLQAASFDKALQTKVSSGWAISVLGDVLAGEGDAQGAAAIRQIAAAAGDSQRISLAQLIDLGPYGSQDHVGGASGTKISANAMDVAKSVLTLAAGGRQVKFDLDASVPGLTDVEAWLAIGERPNNSPWLTVDRAGQVTIRTAQMRLYVKATALGALGVLGLKPVTIPIYLEAAQAEAKLSSLECPSAQASQAATLSVRPGLGEIFVAEIDPSRLNDFKTPMATKPATLLDLALVKVTGEADVKIGGNTWTPVRFTRADINGGVVKTASTTDIAQAATSSLLGNTRLTANVLGFGLNTASITNAVSGVLAQAAAPLDALINNIGGVAGVRLGEADVRVNGLRCHEAALVS